MRIYFKEHPFLKDVSGVLYSRFSHGVTGPMLVYRTLAKKCFVEFWEFDPVIMQNLSDILRLSCAPKWPSHHVRENLRSTKPRSQSLSTFCPQEQEKQGGADRVSLIALLRLRKRCKSWVVCYSK